MYQLNKNSIIRLADQAYIPTDPANSDYAAYLKWQAEGNTPKPADVPSFASLKATQFAEFNIERTKYLDALSGISGRAARAGDTETARLCDSVAEGLLALKDDPAVVAATNLPGLKQAMSAAYARLITGIPPKVLAVFAKAKS